MIKVLVVTGSGRSGTSSAAGTLKRLGFHVPQPEVEPDERNPRGYYEPLWVSEFHKHWLNGIRVRTIDGRPHAGDIAMADVTPEREEELRSWLAAELARRRDGDVVVVKETRAYWVYPLWQRVVAATGAELASLTMLRHPTQVVRSRDSAYLSGRSDELRRQRETANVAAWANSVFVTERATRGNPRAFVPYEDLIGDWRAAITLACAQVGVDPGDLSAPHPVDDFVTTSLNRSATAWDGLSVPPVLVDLAERTWAAALALVEKPDDAAATAALDGLQAEYAELYRTSAAIVSDETSSDLQALRAELEARLAVKNQRLDKLRRKLRAAENAETPTQDGNNT
ncbi:sulfotransferase family protein [Nocardioides rubriscoriae]|uniref:sulfotransferase family protein n=1 Tax=Nocardioides rubriscoriae TaxID=642762 RepID=UPI0011DF5BBD|nr:hypothetical protein [Nocardioides rubriscoriae]